MEQIEVSVICTTYNHEKYIAKALDSILSQRTNFGFEVIVHDDCSTDDTAKIVLRYQEMYPDRVKAICEQENQYSKGARVIGVAFAKTRGRYIAFCEGDDFWIDDDKLQLQYDAMEEHPECDMCACRAAVVVADSLLEIQEIRPQSRNAILPVEDVIRFGGNYIATASLFFRRENLESTMEFEKIIPTGLDYVQQIKSALRGGIVYLDRKMAAYRTNVNNSAMDRYRKSRAFRQAQFQKEVAMLRKLDEETGGRYHTVIEKRIPSYREYIDMLRENREQILSELSELDGDAYIWGLGMRGDACQEFCQEEGIPIAGVCDAKNTDIGEDTSYGYKIYDTKDVFGRSKNILATNRYVYQFLTENGYPGKVIDMERYMP